MTHEISKILKVIDSCKTPEHVSSTISWINNMKKSFGSEDYIWFMELINLKIDNLKKVMNDPS